MAYEQTQRYIELDCSSTAYSTSQYKMVIASSSAGYFAAGSTKSAGTIQPIVGVLQGAPTVAGEPCQIALMDGAVGKLICGSTKLSPGKKYIMGGTGRAQSTASAVAQDLVFGPWLTAAGSTDVVGTAVYQILGITT